MNNNSPESHAQYVLFQHKVNSLPVVPAVLAEKMGIKYIEDDLGSPRINGRLERRGSRALLVVNSGISNRGRKNFTGAHEIGHFCLPGHEESQICGPRSMEEARWVRYDSSTLKKEWEANRFAAELLMPTKLLSAILEKKVISMELIAQTAQMCDVSVMTASIKLLSLSVDKAAVIFSKNGNYQWGAQSKHVLTPFRRGKINQETKAFNLASKPSYSQAQQGHVSAFHWFIGNQIPADLRVYEHSILIPEANGVLSLLVFSDDSETDYEFDTE